MFPRLITSSSFPCFLYSVPEIGNKPTAYCHIKLFEALESIFMSGKIFTWNRSGLYFIIFSFNQVTSIWLCLSVAQGMFPTALFSPVFYACFERSEEKKMNVEVCKRLGRVLVQLWLTPNCVFSSFLTDFLSIWRTAKTKTENNTFLDREKKMIGCGGRAMFE